MSEWYGDGPFDSGELSPEEAFLARRQEASINAYGHNTVMLSDGFFGPSPTENQAVASPVSDDGGIGFQQDTSGVLNNEAFVVNQFVNIERQMNPWLRFKFALSQLTDCRFFIGMTSSISGQISFDTGGNFHYAGVQFSSVRGGGDTNWQLISTDGVAANQEITDSGAPVDTKPHSLLIQFDNTAPAVRMVLFDETGLQLKDVTHKTAIPDATTGMTPAVGTEALAAAVKSHVFYYANGILRGLEV